MKRRQFLRSSAAAAGALALEPAALQATTGAEACQEPLPPSIAALRSRTAEAPLPISEEERAARRAKAQRVMAEQGIDALFVEPGASLGYFTSISWGRSERTFGLLLPREGAGMVISPAFEEQKAESLVAGRFEVRTWQEDQSPFALIAATLKDRRAGTGTLAVEESTRWFIAHGIAAAAPGLRVRGADPVVNACRGLKTAHEVELMRFANRITVEAFRAALQALREGMTERELARLVSQAFQRLGYSGGALVLFGEASAYPHGVDRPHTLQPGDVVLVDGGTSVHGYASDVTRTVAFGAPSSEVERVFEIVKTAQARALAAARPGRTCGEIDAVARRVVEESGYGPDYKYFTHRLGHGIGMEGHEWPYLVRGSTVVLEPGMSFSNEPGIYQYGKFGVRLEDIMVITESGAELLTEPAQSLAV